MSRCLQSFLLNLRVLSPESFTIGRTLLSLILFGVCPGDECCRRISFRPRKMAEKKVLLVGSSSVQHRCILEAAFGDRFDIICRSPDINENDYVHANPPTLVTIIARAKMERILAMIDQDPELKGRVDYAVTTNQLALFQGVVRGKPNSEREAFAYLSNYSNSSVSTVSGIVVADVKRSRQVEGDWWTNTEFTAIPDEIKRKVIARGHVMSCVGGFAVDDEDLMPLRSFAMGTQEEVQGMSTAVFGKLLAELEAASSSVVE